jgi:Holliday junction resolvasome RuvABC endonuclease subunit
MHLSTSTSWIGIDPSARSSGLAIITEGEVPIVYRVSPKNLRGAERLAFIRNEFVRFVSPLISGTPIACIEGPSLHSQNKADTLGQVRGIYLLALTDLNAEITVVAPTALKKFATKNGMASKDRMVNAAYAKWHLHLGDDEADAAWLAQLAYSLTTNKVDTREQLEVISGIRSPKTKPVVRFKHKTNV